LAPWYKHPVFPDYNPNNVRGTIPYGQVSGNRNALPPYGRLSFVISYHTGARKCEIRKIRREVCWSAAERAISLTNMIEARLSEKEALEISGHKSRAVFDRYHIVSSRRVRELGKKMEVHLAALNNSVLDKILRSRKVLKTMVSRAGLEPATTALKVRCSTD
jgi:hypothetical protein